MTIESPVCTVRSVCGHPYRLRQMQRGEEDRAVLPNARNAPWNTCVTLYSWSLMPPGVRREEREKKVRIVL